MSKEYDVVVLGAGPAGYVAAIQAAQFGQKAAIVEKNALGGVCLNVGCIPSKALLHNAEIAHTLSTGSKEFGFSFDNLKLDYGAAFKRSRQVSQRLVKGVAFLMRKNKIDVLEGIGKFNSPNSMIVSQQDGDIEVTAKNFIIATGAHPASVPGIEVDGDKIVSYEKAIMADSLPGKVVIVGGGPIGMEFAYIWVNYGVEVTIVEMLPHLLPNEDPEISQVVERAFKKLGVKFHTGVRVESIVNAGDGIEVRLEGAETIAADKVLVAVGFKPNISGIGLDQAGVETSDWGAIVVDESMKTSVPHIYAIGDVVAPEGIMLAHVGSAMGIVAAESIAGKETAALDYRMMPRCTYCVPQVASFGYTEAQAIDAGYEVKIGRFPFQANGKALGVGERDGFVKIVADARYGEILGGHMVGHGVTELLPELTLARFAELTAEEIAQNVHAHPTMSEALMEAAHSVEGEAIHA